MGFQPKPSNWLVLDETHHRVFITDTSFTIELWSLALLVIGGTPLLVGNNHDCSGYLIWFILNNFKRFHVSWPTPNWQTSWLEWSSQCWYLKSSTFRTGINMKRAPHSNSKCWRSTTGCRTKTRHPDGSPYPANAAARPCHAKNVGWWMAQWKVVLRDPQIYQLPKMHGQVPKTIHIYNLICFQTLAHCGQIQHRSIRCRWMFGVKPHSSDFHNHSIANQKGNLYHIRPTPRMSYT